MNSLRDTVVAVVVLLAFTLLCGVLFPLAITGAGQLVFAHQSNGSLIRQGDVVVGSEVIGQLFAGEQYFHGRPSATSPAYNGLASSGSNLGPTNPALAEAVGARAKAEAAAAAAAAGARVPIDLVTASGSGLDPHLTPEAALFQVERVAAARHLAASAVSQLVQQHVEGRSLFLGEPRVNVLALNRALDALAPPAPPTAATAPTPTPTPTEQPKSTEATNDAADAKDPAPEAKGADNAEAVP